MQFLVCTTDTSPCPPGDVASVALSGVLDFAALGITSGDMLYVWSWGFSMVLFGWIAGYGIQLAIVVIRKL